MAVRVVQRALGAVSMAAGAARHVAWYVSYCVDPKARTGPAAEGSEATEAG